LARAAGTQLIRTKSVRDSRQYANVAILDPAAIISNVPTYGQTWHFRYEQGILSALAAFPGTERYSFDAMGFGLGA
jgi:hypothetical protein